MEKSKVKITLKSNVMSVQMTYYKAMIYKSKYSKIYFFSFCILYDYPFDIFKLFFIILYKRCTLSSVGRVVFINKTNVLLEQQYQRACDVFTTLHLKTTVYRLWLLQYITLQLSSTSGRMDFNLIIRQTQLCVACSLLWS
jgi:hypothetical protein